MTGRKFTRLSNIDRNRRARQRRNYEKLDQEMADHVFDEYFEKHKKKKEEE